MADDAYVACMLCRGLTTASYLNSHQNCQLHLEFSVHKLGATKHTHTQMLWQTNLLVLLALTLLPNQQGGSLRARLGQLPRPSGGGGGGWGV